MLMFYGMVLIGVVVVIFFGFVWVVCECIGFVVVVVLFWVVGVGFFIVVIVLLFFMFCDVFIGSWYNNWLWFVVVFGVVFVLLVVFGLVCMV